MNYKIKRQNARGIIIGGSIPYNYSSVNTLNNIYVGNLLINSNCIAKGVTLSFYGNIGDTANVIVSLADYDGNVLKKSTHKNNLRITNEDVINYNFNFGKKIELENNRTYFILVQLSNIVGDINLVVVSQTENLINPLCNLFIGDLTKLKKIKVPKTYIPVTCPVGNLF